MQTSHKLKSNDQNVFILPSLKTVYPDWSSNHRRVFVAYNDQELKSAKNGAKGHIQIVSHSSIKENK